MTESPGIVIRRPIPDDSASAGRVFEAAIADAFAREGLENESEEIEHEISLKKRLLAKALDRETAGNGSSPPLFLVAEQDSEVIGTISFGPCSREVRECAEGRLNEVGELGTLYVRPDLQDCGIGSALISALMRELQRLGIHEFCLDSGYRRAQARWKRKFGEPYAVVPDYWGPGVPHMVWYCRVLQSRPGTESEQRDFLFQP
ncbi:GNAT family N-acetyltransferase [Saccharibacillus deserti]|uniref:GNAT family N-acetyltransferase n=1 Tax=Saccharibacillus deserti TaxID=1634444 RepID=UPI00155549E9|nr:GNAT family N-acetyltransferase [Saccharibacillus deserti]